MKRLLMSAFHWLAQKKIYGKPLSLDIFGDIYKCLDILQNDGTLGLLPFSLRALTLRAPIEIIVSLHDKPTPPASEYQNILY